MHIAALGLALGSTRTQSHELLTGILLYVQLSHAQPGVAWHSCSIVGHVLAVRS